MQKIDKNQLQVAIAELVRERNVREKYYPRAIAERKLSKQEAEKRLNALNTAIQILMSLLDGGGQ